MARKKAGVGVHAHGCTECSARYEDACSIKEQGPRGGIKDKPGPNGRCNACRTGHKAPWWPEAWWPKDCCRAEARPATEGPGQEVERYKLAGGGRWYICPTCSRTFPKNPRVEMT